MPSSVFQGQQDDSTHGVPRKTVASERFSETQLLDSEEAAALMKVHPKTLQKLARRGELKGIHVGKLWRFREMDIADWIQRQVAS
jgi:excisionase family DNA binding protein